MIKLMKTDGEITYYSIEPLLRNLDTDEEKYYGCERLETFRDALAHDLYQEFSNRGECSRKYGHLGTLNYDTALAMLMHLQEHVLDKAEKPVIQPILRWPDNEYHWADIIGFRIVKNELSQKTTYCEEISSK